MTHSNSPFNEPAGLQGSYLNTNMGLAGTLSEFRNLFRIWRPHNIPTLIRRNLEEARAREVEINALLGAPVAGLKLLEIGPGQQLVQLAYFGTKNEVVGIDLDVIMHRLNLRDCLRILKQNGWLRTCKTVGRKLARIDTLVRKEVALQLGLQTTPDLRVLQMDATKDVFPRQSVRCRVLAMCIRTSVESSSSCFRDTTSAEGRGSYVNCSSFVYMRRRLPRHAHLCWSAGRLAVLGAFAAGPGA
jgi:hypothetical protein